MATAVEIAHAHGIVIPQIAFDVSRSVGVPFWATCAFLMQESGGGHNVFGHDAGMPFAGAGEVTESKYRDYKAERIKTGHCQGVGPMQLTFHTFQDEADAMGGAWLPIHNVTEGMRIVKQYVDGGASWHEAARRYNGSGEAAEAYADQMDDRFTFWQGVLADAPPEQREQAADQEQRPADLFEPVSWRGHTFDKMTIAAILAAEDRLGFQVIITQGSYNTSVSASGQTHAGSGALDMHYDPATSDRIVLAMRQTGFACWRRFANTSWPDHIHGELLNDPMASDEAKSQWAAYRRGEDALGGDDLGPRLDPIPIFRFESEPVWPRLHSTSDAIGLMQRKLALAGYYRGGDDENFYGTRTRAAIRVFQQAQHWTGANADGLLGPVTWARIQALPSEPPGHPKLEEARTDLRKAIADHPKWVKLKGAVATVRKFLTPKSG
jgi:putative peptidoglycan binding protein